MCTVFWDAGDSDWLPYKETITGVNYDNLTLKGRSLESKVKVAGIELDLCCLILSSSYLLWFSSLSLIIPRLIFYNLKKLEPKFVFWLTVLASKCVHNFLPQFSSDLTLPGNMLITEYARCIPYWRPKNCAALRRLHYLLGNSFYDFYALSVDINF